jgi:D-alanine-D-alanine ligase
MTAIRRVAVLMGGLSSEHDVSLRSGAGMLKELDPARYLGFPVLISKDNVWHWPAQLPQQTLQISAQTAAEYLQNPPADWVSVRFPQFSRWPTCDLALLALHGVGGEDGRLQGFFEMAGQPFTGSGSFGSASAMDKILSKQVYQVAGIPTAEYRVLSRLDREGVHRQALLQAASRDLGFPMLVKHPKGGSSLGMGIAKDAAELESLVTRLGVDEDPLLLEAFVKGREITCGVLEGKPPLAPTEIRPKQDGFFNYEAKYQSGRTEEITPAPMEADVIARIQDLAWKCHRALRLSVYSRTDMIVSDQGIFVLETNNLPGFTPTSILPQQAHYAGLSYRDLLTHILETSFARWHAPSAA